MKTKMVTKTKKPSTKKRTRAKPKVFDVQVSRSRKSKENSQRESEQLIGRLSALLTSIANALKGEPAGLNLHDWSDLPAIAASLRQQADESRPGDVGLNYGDLLTIEREAVRVAKTYGGEISPREAAYQAVSDICESARARLREKIAAIPVRDDSHQR